MIIALVGNPNCGKTTLFNALTGSTQYAVSYTHLENGYYWNYMELCLESPSSELYWNIYGWTPDRVLIAGFRAETNTPVCYGLVPWSESLSDLLLGYGYDPEVFSGAGGYGY